MSINLTKASDGFLKLKDAEDLSPRTIDSYDYYLRQWIAHIGDQDVGNITASTITAFLIWTQTGYMLRKQSRVFFTRTH